MSDNTVSWNLIINSSSAIKSLNAFSNSVDKTVNSVSKKLGKIEDSFHGISKILGRLERQNKGSNQFGLAKQLNEASRAADRLERKLDKIEKKTSTGGSKGGRSSRMMSGAMGMLGGLGIYSMFGGVGAMRDSGVNFEKTMVDIQGILANAEGGFGSLDVKIREVGRTSAYTITQMGEAAKFMAMAGMGGSDITNSLKSVSNLGMVGNLDVGRSADIMTNIMASMGIGSKQSGAVTDILTATVTNSNVSIEELGASFAYTGNIAAQTGRSINETAAAIGILGNNGIKASRAGTNLSQVFSRLAAPTTKGKKTIEDLGLSLYRIGVHGKRELKPISEILTQFKDSGAGLTEFKAIFGERGQRAFGALVNNAKKYSDILEKIQGSSGITQSLADKKMATTAGKTFVMKSKWEDLSITLMEKVRPAYNFVLDGMSKLFDKLRNNEGFLEKVEHIANGIAVAIKGAYHVMKFLFNFVIDNWATIVKAIAAISAALVGLATVSLAVQLANPFTAWIISAVSMIGLLDEIAKRLPSTEETGDRMSSMMDAAGKWYNATIGVPVNEVFSDENTRKRAEASAQFATANSDILYDQDQFRKNRGNNRDNPATRTSLHDQISDTVAKFLKDTVAPKGGDVDTLLKQLEKIQSSVKVNLGLSDGSGSGSGNEEDPLSSISPLTSTANEMSRSVVVNIYDGLLHVENQNIGLDNGSLSVSNIEKQISEALISVVSDFELGMSH